MDQTNLGGTQPTAPQTPTPAPAPNMNPTGMPMPEEHHSSLGPVVGSIVIVLIIVLGGLYLYGDKIGMQKQVPTVEAPKEITPEEISAQADGSISALQQQGGTDAISEISSDLSATDLNALDAELSNINSELSF
jgi:hypothetical protein